MRLPFLHIPLILAGIVTISACNDASQLAGSKKSDNGKGDDDDTADEPVEVSGAFLTCDWLEPQSTTNTTLVGCSVVDKNGTAFDQQNRNFALTLHNDDDTKVNMVTVDGFEDNSWQKLAQLPSSHNNTGYLKMEMRKGVVFEGSFNLNTVDIGSNVALGNEMAGEGVAPKDNPGLALTSVTADGKWDGGELAQFYIDPENFCDDNGVVRTTFDEKNTATADKVKQLGIVVNKDIETTAVTIEYKAATCFDKFKAGSFLGKEEWVQKNKSDTCYLLHSGPNVFIINKSNAKSINPDFNMDNLKAFAEKKKCL